MNSTEVPAADNENVVGRIALCLAYNGHAYHGWQYQNDTLPTVQGFVEQAISKVANEPIEVVCAGRTDSSVHASYQIVHFDTKAKRSPRAWVFGCNANLPKDISVSWAGEVPSDFHARYSAFNRRYQYVIFNHPIRPASFTNELTWCHYELDAQRMHEAAQVLVGEHDFSSFRAVGCQSKSPFRHIDFVNVQRFGHIIVIDIQGNAFLHHMVRNIAGVLMAIGAGKEPVAWCGEVLAAKDRTKAAVTAAPYGLYLIDVGMPEEFNIPRSEGPPSLIQAFQGSAFNLRNTEELWEISRLAKS